MMFESNDSTTYYVVVDHLATWGCYAYDLTLTQVFSGCMDSLAINYDPSATVDDGSCEYDFVYGCIDELACNYVDTADVDDGSCIYPASESVDCDGNCLFNTVVVTLVEDYGDGSTATLSVNGDQLINGAPSLGYGNVSTVTADACVDLASCLSVTFNSNGDYYTSEVSWSVADTSGNILASGGDYSNISMTSLRLQNLVMLVQLLVVWTQLLVTTMLLLKLIMDLVHLHKKVMIVTVFV